MKRGISVKDDFDTAGNIFYRITKKRGKLTLDEIREALTEEVCEDYYFIVMKAIDVGGVQFDEDDPKGDEVDVYEKDCIFKGFACPLCGALVQN